MNSEQKNGTMTQPFVSGPMRGILFKEYDLKRFQKYLPGLDLLFVSRDSRAIKNFGNTRTSVVSLDLGNGQEQFVLKKFRTKNIFNQLYSTFGQSRASKVWKLSHKLIALGIPIPPPVAAVEKRQNGLLKSSYFLSRFLAKAINLKLCVNTDGIGFLEDGRFMKNVGLAIGRMHRSNLIHGDLKWSNILLWETNGVQNPIFVDFDHLKLSKSSSNFDRARDLARFMADLQEVGLSSQLAGVFLNAYFDSSEIENKLRARFSKKMERAAGKIIRRHQRKATA